jgi:CHAD domain-containing protein
MRHDPGVAYRLGNSESPAHGIRRAAREELDNAIRQLTEGVSSDPVTGVHEARKSVKKERALLRLVRRELGDDTYRAENTALRDAARRLSGLRDAQVGLLTLDRLAEPATGHVPPSTMERVRTALAADGAAHTPAGLPAAAAAVAVELTDVRVRTKQWHLGRDDWKLVSGGLRRAYERGRAALAEVEADPTVEHLHDWRKRVKDLWYHARLLQPLWPEVMEAQAEQAHVLSELLGDDHDLAVLRERLVGDPALAGAVPADLDPLIAVIDRRRAELVAEAQGLGRRLYAERPSAFERRMKALWRAWRPRNSAASVSAQTAQSSA